MTNLFLTNLFVTNMFAKLCSGQRRESAMSSPAPAPVAEAVVPKNIRWILLGILLAMLLSMLDGLIVGTAMPTVVADIGGLDHISWVVTAYTLTTACSTPVWGKLGDLSTLCAAAAFLAAVFIQEVPLSRQPAGNQ